MRITSWNINSVRLRIDQVRRFLETEAPDVLCLQETKCHDDQFPRKAFEKAGYPHLAISGQKGYHGVAIASRVPLGPLEPASFCCKGEARHIAAVLPGDVVLHNFYVPAGGDVPDPELNDKFAHKLDFLEQMRSFFESERERPSIVVGDLNIAPEENDVWSHKQLLKVVSHTPVEVDAMRRLIADGGFLDVARRFHGAEEKLYSWWSYRAKDWAASDRGRRLDHIWVSEPLSDRLHTGGENAFRIHRDVRGWERPSDHAPVSFDIGLK
jgi:exodeoxyribonuclease-3